MAIDLQVAKRLFFHMAIADFFRAIRGKCYMGAFTLSVCAIDAMAYLAKALPDEGIGASFKHSVERWLVPLNNKCVPDVLWAVRCGFVHTYGFSEAMANCGIQAVRYAHNAPKLHWEQHAPDFYILSLDRHIAEVTVAAFRFFDDLASICQNDPRFESELNDRLQSLNLIRRIEITRQAGGRPSVKMTVEAPPMFAGMHRALACLDEDAPPDVATIETEIQEIYATQ